MEDKENEQRKIRKGCAECPAYRPTEQRNSSHPKPQNGFWKLLNKLYEVHDAFKKCVPYFASADKICKEIEDVISELQQQSTLPQQFSVEELLEQEAV